MSRAADCELEQRAAAKEQTLTDWLRARRRVAIGFSGGVDSAYLAVVARRTLGADDVLAIIGRSASYPAEQWATARRVADAFDVPVLELDTDELNDPRYAANPTNRCYFCKTELWGKARARRAERAGFTPWSTAPTPTTSADHRPGAQAAREHGVASPLAELGFTKEDIRARSRALGLPDVAAAVVALPVVAPSVRNRGHAASDSRRSSGPSVRCARSASRATCACAITTTSRASSSRRPSSRMARARAARDRCATR